MPSPFDKKNQAAAAAAPAAAASTPTAAPAAPATLPGPMTAGTGQAGEDRTTAKSDPFGNVKDASGISGYKPAFFLGQMVLMNPTEHGSMPTEYSTPENPESEYVKFNIVPLTVPAPGEASQKLTTVSPDGESFQFLNKDGDIETCPPYEIGERIEDVLVFNGPLIREGKKALDKGDNWVRGWIVRGVKKGKNSPPYILKALTEEDIPLYNERVAIAAARAQ